DRAHAVAADGIDRNAALLERAHNAQVRKPSRAASAEHEPDRTPRESSPETLGVRGCVDAHMVVSSDSAPGEPFRRARRRTSARLVHGHELDLRLVRQMCGRRAEKSLLYARRSRMRGGSRRENDSICLTKASLRPARWRVVAFVHHESMRTFLRVEPRRELVL